jgi:multiple sugar transport system substrate-binding protein
MYTGEKSIVQRIVSATPMVVLVLFFVFSVLQVARTTIHKVSGKKVVLDFLWPTFTPQRVRYGEYLVQEYMKRNPDVHINLVYTPDPGRKLQVMIAGRTTPDVAWLGVGWPQFTNALYPLDEFVAADPEVHPEDYNATLWKAVQWKGSVRALPSSGQTGIIYYNKDLFDDAGLDYPTEGWTWEDMERMGRALTKDFDGDGMIDQYGLQLEGLAVAPFYLYDGQIADPEWTEARVDTPVTVAILDRYQKLMYGETPCMPSAAATQELGMLPMFEAGRTAMTGASSYAIETFRNAPFDWDIVILPKFIHEGKTYRATGLWQEEYGMFSDTDELEESWKFIKWCASREAVQWAAVEGHIVPGRTDVAQSDAYLHSGKRPANMVAFIESHEFAVPIWPHPWWKRISVAFENPQNMFLQGSEGIRPTAAETCVIIQENLQKMLDEYREEHPDE